MTTEEEYQTQDQVTTAPKTVPMTDEITKLFKAESDQSTFENMKYLTNLTEYLIGDKVYTRKMLKPKDLKEFTNLQTELMALGDTNIEKKMELLEKLGIISLEGFTHEDFENCDILMLEQVIAAQFLISKGFRKVEDKRKLTA